MQIKSRKNHRICQLLWKHHCVKSRRAKLIRFGYMPQRIVFCASIVENDVIDSLSDMFRDLQALALLRLERTTMCSLF